MRSFLRRLLWSRPDLSQFGDSGRAASVRTALDRAARGGFTAEEEAAMAAVEASRRRMLNDSTLLQEWDRPWLAASPELRERMGISGTDDRYTTEMSVATATRASKRAPECRVLFALIREIQPKVVLEIGTNVGVSGAYIAAALRLNGLGVLTTLEGSSPKADLAARNFDVLGLAKHVRVVVGDFSETLRASLGEVGDVNVAFIDGYHDSEATTEYHRTITEHASSGAVLVYDDIGWSDGMRSAWRTIAADLEVAVDVRGVGYCVLPR